MLLPITPIFCPMTMSCCEGLTLNLEFLGFLLMGLDYLLNVRQLGMIESHAQAIAQRLSANFANDITERIAFIRQRAYILLVATLMFLAGAAIWGALTIAHPANPFVVIGVILVVLFLVIGPFIEFGTHLLAVVYPATVNLVPLLFIKLVSASPRGILAGIGFALFVGSFACKFSRLH